MYSWTSVCQYERPAVLTLMGSKRMVYDPLSLWDLVTIVTGGPGAGVLTSGCPGTGSPGVGGPGAGSPGAGGPGEGSGTPTSGGPACPGTRGPSTGDPGAWVTPPVYPRAVLVAGVAAGVSPHRSLLHNSPPS